ncbi:MAG TPA: ABC transporter ATP-binding protein [Deltaproteobacteria bacterium]|nr:MAG: ABC transporter ATP-binding protein [Deltaproteobacteria bacterium GWC2_65_14]HBO68714.1 ABC transporter ATP-binding protein [Deltaproteobacteria bacterium]
MIEIRGLCKRFGKNVVLDGVDLDVPRGKNTVVIGGSGTGKSVLIKCVVGLLRADAGQIRIDGEDVTSMDERELVRVRRKFGMLFQGSALFDSMNVGDNVAFSLRRLHNYPERQVRDVVGERLAMVGLRDIQHLMPAELSGGMKKRVGLARAIASEPEILLYDEPTTGLDPIMADVINDLIISLRESLGVTSISITHDMASAYKIADQIAMLYKGRIVEVGTPERIRASENPVVSQFVEGRAQGPITAEHEEFIRFVRRTDDAGAPGGE